MQQSLSNIHGVHSVRTVLQQAIGKAPRRRAHVRAYQPAHRQLRLLQRTRQLGSAAAHKTLPLDHLQLRANFNRGARFIHAHSAHPHLPGHDVAPGRIDRLHQAALEHQFIKPITFHRA